MGQRLDNAKALYLEAIRDGNPVEAINAYAGDRYTQHSTPVKDGRAGFIEFFGEFLERNPIRDVEIIRAFEDGQFVFLHVTQILNDGEFRYATADIFDTDGEGKLIEHWDLIQEMPAITASGDSMVDGPTESTDLDKTEANKDRVRSFMTEVLVNGNRDAFADHISTETYIEHSPTVGAGFEGFGAYDSIHNLIGSGNFVAALSQMKMAGVNSAVIDLFRVEDDRIVEHWNVIETITPQETWVNSGKF